MGFFGFRALLSACLFTGLLLVGVAEKASAQQVPEPAEVTISNPATPQAAEPTTPTAETPQVGPNQAGTATPPGGASSAGPSVATPPVRATPSPATTSAVAASRNSSRNNNSFSPRLARAAPIMGDTLSPSLLLTDELGMHPYEVPQGGGATRSKIAENSSSLPIDRWIFNYNHFHSAITDTETDSADIDRFTFGFEKTFLDQMMSIEVRMPFVVDNDFQNVDFTRNGSDVGNLSVTLKGVLTSDDTSLIAAGLTIDTPTGGDSVLTLSTLADPLTVDISNDAVHLSPFLGFLCAPTSGNTHQGFLQVDVPTNANTLEFSDTSGVTETNLLEQTLLYVDYSFSTPLYYSSRGARRNGNCIRRILGLAELHYTTTLEDSDVVLSGTASNPLFEISSAGNRLDVVNLTLGLHTEFVGGTQLRLGTVAPITDDYDRFFDFEFQAQLNVPLR